MHGMVSSIPHRISFASLFDHLFSRLSRPAFRAPAGADSVVENLSDAQRDDLGFENPPLAAVSKFQGFELDAWVGKQSPDALQYYLLRGIEP